MPSYEVAIVGGGPSGCAAALELANLGRNLAGHVLLLDKAVFSRHKLCAGGVSIDSDAVLRDLGVEIDVPAVPVHTTQFVLPTGRLTFHRSNQFRVLGRREFDYSLFQAVRTRGVITRDGEPVIEVVNTHDEVIVRTTKDEYRVKV